jgi:hypothetical protein
MPEEKKDEKGILNEGAKLVLAAVGVAAALQVATEGAGPVRPFIGRKAQSSPSHPQQLSPAGPPRGAARPTRGGSSAKPSGSPARAAAPKAPKAPKAAGAKRASSAYQKFVKARLSGYIASGMSNADAMKRVAAEWRRRK